MSEYYVGRLACDGYGNLLADEGDRAGDPVAYDEGKFVFLKPGEDSHNERHHAQFVDIEGTTDDSAGSPDDPTPGQEHHWGPTEDDAHYAAGYPNNTRLRFDPDKVAAKITGHTEAYNG